ncbi:MAG: phosphoribosyl-ATP diphosphatase [Candidatus Margulisiibacteriota bacterium]
MHFLATLDHLIESRKDDVPENSYTAQLYHSGLDRILRKVGEEAAEVIIAAKNTSDHAFVGECADLLYHLTVALHARGLTLSAVDKELEKRHRG